MLTIHHIETEIDIDDLNCSGWSAADEVSVREYWSGEPAPVGRHFTANLLWSDSAFYVRFITDRTELLVINPQPDLTHKTQGLWDRDVCEIFIAPDADDLNNYFEFEIAPTGEWVDLRISTDGQKRVTDEHYQSNMLSAAAIGEHKVVMVIKIGWDAFGRSPQPGDVWLGNLFRCVGKGPDRGYLAWMPTRTDIPNFHVPERFGELVFKK